MFVWDFAPPDDRVEALLAYPFRQPEQSYLTDGEIVGRLPDTYEDFCRQTDAYLATRLLPLLADRIPLIAYGANASPARLREKMARYGPRDLQPDLQTIPHIVAEVNQAAIVWHGKPGQGGSTFAELYQGPDTLDKTARCFVQFLTTEQLALLHATEGVTYHLIDLQASVGSDNKPLLAKAYVAGRSEILVKDGSPVEVSRPGMKRGVHAMSAEEAVGYMLMCVETVAGTANVRQYIADSKNLSVEARKARQSRVGAALAALGVSRTFSFPGSDAYYGRAEFSNLQNAHTPQVWQLAEQQLSRLRSEPPGVEDRAPDIMVKIRQRATAELEDRLRHNMILE